MGGSAQRRTQAVNTARSVWSAQKSERSIVATKRLTPAERRGRTWSTRTAQRRTGDDSSGITHTHKGPVAATDAKPQGEGESSLAGMVPVWRPVPGRRAGNSTQGGAGECGGGRSGRSHDGGGESCRRRLPRRLASRVEKPQLPAQSGAESVDTEGRWQTAAAGYPDGEGQGSAGGAGAAPPADI